MKRIALIALVVACSGDSKPETTVTVTVTGTAAGRDASGSTPLAGVTIAAYSNDDETTPVAMTTSDGSGNFTLTATAMGSLDGYLKATIASYMDTYLYPPAPLTADFSGATIVMVTPSTFDLLANTLCGANQLASMGTIAAEVEDGSGAFVAGATVASSPAATKYCYNANGFPSRNATATDTDGLGYMLNVTGTATVTAMKSGLTFSSHPVNARAGALTTTLIKP